MAELVRIAQAETVREATQRLASVFRDLGFDTPEREARAVVLAATGLDAVRVIAEPGIRVAPDAAQRLDAYLDRRLQHEPLSRILGQRDFFGRTFRITRDTLDPRPDSETLIEAALEIATARGWRDRPIRIVDVGTGTGCLLITLLAELPLATGLGIDLSPPALEVARGNAASLGVGERASFQVGRSLEGIGETFDLLVSNPPYIPSAEVATLDPEVRDFDPHLALDGGPDGIEIYREIVARLPHVVPAGAALFEIGAGQDKALISLLEGAGPWHTRSWADLGGHIRTVAAETHR